MREFTLTITEDELNVIGQGLGELPLKISGNLFQKLQAQAFAQMNMPPPVDGEAGKEDAESETFGR